MEGGGAVFQLQDTTVLEGVYLVVELDVSAARILSSLWRYLLVPVLWSDLLPDGPYYQVLGVVSIADVFAQEVVKSVDLLLGAKG